MSRMPVYRALTTIFCAFLLLPAGAMAADPPKMQYGFRTPPSLPPPTKNVYELLESQKGISKFADMIDEADLKSMFSGKDRITVFAPNDGAISDLSSAELKRINANKANLQNFVKHHVILNSVVAGGAIKGRRASPSAANGEPIEFDGSDRSTLKVGDAKIVQLDVRATNGVIHVIDKPLMPASLLPATETAPKTAATVPAAPPGDTAKPVEKEPAKKAGKITETTKKSLAAPPTTAATPASDAATMTGEGASMLPHTATGATTTPPSPPPAAATTTGHIPEVPPNSNIQPQTSQPVENPPAESKSIWKKFGW